MLPNIKQRINARNKGKNMEYWKKASKNFNVSVYDYRGLIGICYYIKLCQQPRRTYTKLTDASAERHYKFIILNQ